MSDNFEKKARKYLMKFALVGGIFAGILTFVLLSFRKYTPGPLPPLMTIECWRDSIRLTNQSGVMHKPVHAIIFTKTYLVEITQRDTSNTPPPKEEDPNKNHPNNENDRISTK